AFPGGGNGTVTANGSGQTIAVVDAYDNPTIANDLQTFDRQFNLPDPALSKVAGDGSAHYPQADAGWALESAPGVAWAHALAPAARILLVEASSSSLADLLAAVDTASSTPGVSVVNMSWGGPEFPDETALDGHFLTGGVTFVAASGDHGAPPQW